MQLAAIRHNLSTMKKYILLLAGNLLLFACETKSQKVKPEEYLEIGKFIWKTYVPKSGQAETIQGELL